MQLTTRTAVIGAIGSGMLVAAQSQKASGAGAVATDTALAPGGGLRNRAGTAVVSASQVAIGKLEVR